MEDCLPSPLSNRLSAIVIYLYVQLRIFFKYNRRTSLWGSTVKVSKVLYAQLPRFFDTDSIAKQNQPVYPCVVEPLETGSVVVLVKRALILHRTSYS